MTLLKRVSVLVLPLVLAACMKGKEGDVPMSSAGQGELHQDAAAFDESVVGSGQPVVMFFDGKNCAPCAKSKKMVEDMYASNTFGVSLYTVDFESETELREKYGVLQPGTVIVVDHEGNLQKTLTDVNPVALRALIQSGR